MAEKTTKERPAEPNQSELATATTEIVTQMARTAAGELVKGQQPLNQVARTVVGEAVETLDKRGPKLAEDAGILNWRYALLGWLTWTIGKRVARRKATAALRRTSKGGAAHGGRERNGGGRDDG
jgi:hypothetical protein